jgi:uncharacterized membrane protein SpoIIM required for sporulation
MGKSFLFPGTHTRLKSLQEGAKDGVKIVVGLVPIFIIAAFIESFITRYYKMPLWMSLSFLFISAVFITWYFIIFPAILYSRKLFIQTNGERLA